MKRHANRDRPVASEFVNDRRRAPRLKPSALPWIKEVSTTGRRGLLIDISAAGLLFETTARLLPGSRTTILLLTDNGRERLDGHVVRSQMIALDGKCQPVYRTAVKFFRTLDLRPTTARAGTVCAHLAVDLSSQRVDLFEADI